eukprot:CAMPEP_0167798890 /NCGR_PEP_ID=MMETSP0111_2-20121227/16635_1 /TAXON_ID=91324 /ORGANISM="Lotharella globosa, Strain CCCM811" /LENGTH=84 /DNA_ID=CAMNT_0007693505 /DNA_START=32 /DNA_END=282 /DNA_ORIENTATION=-
MGVNFINPQNDGHTSLHKAALKGQVSMLEYLLTGEFQSDRSALLLRDKSGATALELGKAMLPNVKNAAQRSRMEELLKRVEQAG